MKSKKSLVFMIIGVIALGVALTFLSTIVKKILEPRSPPGAGNIFGFPFTFYIVNASLGFPAPSWFYFKSFIADLLIWMVVSVGIVFLIKFIWRKLRKQNNKFKYLNQP